MRGKLISTNGGELTVYHYAEKMVPETGTDKFWAYGSGGEQQLNLIPDNPKFEITGADTETGLLVLDVDENWQLGRLSYNRHSTDEWKFTIKWKSMADYLTSGTFVYNAAISHAHPDVGECDPFVERLFKALNNANLEVFLDLQHEQLFEDAQSRDCVCQLVDNLYNWQSLWQIIILDSEYTKGHGDYNWRICLLEATTISTSALKKNQSNVIVIQTDESADSKSLENLGILREEVTWFNIVETPAEDIIFQCVDKVKSIPERLIGKRSY